MRWHVSQWRVGRMMRQPTCQSLFNRCVSREPRVHARSSNYCIVNSLRAQLTDQLWILRIRNHKTEPWNPIKKREGDLTGPENPISKVNRVQQYLIRIQSITDHLMMGVDDRYSAWQELERIMSGIGSNWSDDKIRWKKWLIGWYLS
jgi:hypothetical protein